MMRLIDADKTINEHVRIPPGHVAIGIGPSALPPGFTEEGEMEAHTPGPWRVSDRYEEQTSVVGVGGFNLADADSTLILEGWSDTGARHWSERPGETFREIPLAEARANARLIAAAPDLYAAAVALMSAQPGTDEEWAAAFSLQAAIAAARGQREDGEDKR